MNNTWHGCNFGNYEMNEDGHLRVARFNIKGELIIKMSKQKPQNLVHVDAKPNETFKFFYCHGKYEYFISDKGRLKSRRYVFGTPLYIELLLKNKKDKDGYLITGHISNNSEGYIPSHLHRLVAMIFLKDFDIELTVNHKNLIKDDNRVENLEMLSIGDNIRHGWSSKYKNGYERFSYKKTYSSAENKIKRKLLYEQIKQDRISGMSYKKLSKKYNLSVSNIGMLLLKFFPEIKRFRAEYELKDNKNKKRIK